MLFGSVIAPSVSNCVRVDEGLLHVLLAILPLDCAFEHAHVVEGQTLDDQVAVGKDLCKTLSFTFVCFSTVNYMYVYYKLMYYILISNHLVLVAGAINDLVVGASPFSIATISGPLYKESKHHLILKIMTFSIC